MRGPFVPIAPGQVPCKCCGATAALYGVVDFHKNCESRRREVLGLSGVPVYYHRCPACRFLFTTAFDRLTPDDLRRHVYNADYPLVDPDYADRRPRANAALLARLFPGPRLARVLDYGGGDGLLADLLRAAGFPHAETYDPLVPRHAARPAGRFDLVVSFEAVEHSTDPAATFAEIAGLLADPGLVLFSTLVQPADIDERGLGWWYAAPRNGHVSLYSRESLGVLARRLGLSFGSLDDVRHVLYRRIPDFARRLAPSARTT